MSLLFSFENALEKSQSLRHGAEGSVVEEADTRIEQPQAAREVADGGIGWGAGVNLEFSGIFICGIIYNSSIEVVVGKLLQPNQLGIDGGGAGEICVEGGWL